MACDMMILMRADLQERIDRIAAWSGENSLPMMQEQVENIRRDAWRHGLSAVTELASHLAGTLALGHPGPALSTYAALMQDALDCGDHHDAASVYMAALSNRMGVA